MPHWAAKPSKGKFILVISSSFRQGRHLKVWKREPQRHSSFSLDMEKQSWPVIAYSPILYVRNYLLACARAIFHSIYDISYAFDFLFLIWRLFLWIHIPTPFLHLRDGLYFSFFYFYPKYDFSRPLICSLCFFPDWSKLHPLEAMVFDLDWISSPKSSNEMLDFRWK